MENFQNEAGFGLPHCTQVDSGPLFMSEISQKIGQAYWRPQFMGKTKKMKKTLAKICQEVHLKWNKASHVALLQTRRAPRSGLKLNPFKIVYERTFQILVLRAPPLDLDHETKV